MKNIAIFASGEGSNFQSIQSHIQSGNIPANIVLIVSNKHNSGAIRCAKKYNISTLIINTNRYPNVEIMEATLLKALLKCEVNLICLAGYMKLLPKSVVKQYENQILNIHPALLPKFGGKGFYGMNIHEAVIESGAEESGVTVHFVDEQYDHGNIIVQKKVKVLPIDTAEELAARVLKVEHVLYPKVVKAFCEDRIIWENNNPKIEVSIEN